MRRWLQVRRLDLGLLTILGMALVLPLISDWSITLPSLLGRDGSIIPLPLVLPFAVAIAVAFSLTTGDPLLERVASRPILLLDSLYAGSIAVAALLVCLLIEQVFDIDLALETGRNALGYIGLVLLGRRMLGVQVAALVPIVVVLGLALLGISSSGAFYWWSWPFVPDNNLWSWVVMVSLLIVGMLATLIRPGGLPVH
ncbi:MAG: hypothetical protein HC828_09995 [Blastochloris sp.]|nr:hypothetical protein [Blastochloris sp.]